MTPSDNREDQGKRRRFPGKRAIVTGAGSGIGRAVARQLLLEGARVILFGRTRARLEEARGSTPERYAQCVVGRHEVEREVDGLVQATRGFLGGVDLLVNCAGEYQRAPLGETSTEAWNQMLSSNLTGPFLVTRALLPSLREARGSVVNVSSTLGLRPVAGVAAYAAAKAGLIQLTKSLALEEAPHGVRACVVCPGVVSTPLHTSHEEGRQFLEAAGALHPLGRVGTPEEAAGAILFLASEDSAWTTGAVLCVDGGIALT